MKPRKLLKDMTPAECAAEARALRSCRRCDAPLPSDRAGLPSADDHIADARLCDRCAIILYVAACGGRPS